MATLVLGVAGAAIGSSFGYASLGWSIGSMLGNYLFAPKQPTQYGPRLGDLKVQVSTYGNAIPIVYGSVRVAGNCIWSTPKIETAHVSESGGKGGGGGVTQVSYTYSQSFAIAICEGEITGIRKIWANGKLIYNLSDTATVETIIASNKAAAGIRIYTGSETQMPDALIQAYVGVADTPAYRGTAYVVFENLQLLNEWGQQMPNLEFEVVRTGTATYELRNLGSWACHLPASIVKSGNYVYVTGNSDYQLRVYSAINSSNLILLNTISTGIYSPTFFAISDEFLFLISPSTVYGASANLLIYSLANPELPVLVNTTLVDTQEALALAVSGNYIFISSTTYGGLGPIIPNLKSYLFNSETNAVSSLSTYANITLNTSGLDILQSNYLIAKTPNSFDIYEIAIPSSIVLLTSFFYANLNDIAVVENYVYAIGLNLGIIDCSVPASPVTVGTLSLGGYTGNRIKIEGNNAYVASTVSNVIIVIDVTDKTAPVIRGAFASVIAPYNFEVSDNVLYEVSNANSLLKTQYYTNRLLTAGSVSLSSIVSDICLRAGLAAGDIDVTALTDTVDGYVVQRGTARSWLEPLMQAFYFDAVESDGKIKFVKRGGAATVAIPEADLAAHEYGTQLPDNLITTRKQEMELPVEVDVQYMDTSAGYQIGSQQSRRLTTDSDNKISVNLPIAMTGTKGKQVADVLMYEAWTSRMLFDFQTSWKYAHLEPTDVVTVTKGNRTYTLRLVDEDASGGIYRRQAVLEDASIYTQSATAAPITVADDTVSSVPLTDMVLMDIPLLRDQDDGVGFYAAACGYADGWYGAQAFKSNDGGATWTSFGPGFLNEATIGSASTVLGDFHSGNIFDELNSVTVVLTNGTLSSDTETNVLNGARVYLLGNEILQAKNAVLTAPMTYVLTGLLRGRRGTEFGMSTHAVGERFVELTSTTTYLFTGTSDEYDLVRKYRGVSFGGFLDDAATISFTNTAASLMPYSPTHLGGGRNAALDVILTCVRRTRIGGAWNNYADVPLGEASEAYEVEIWNSTYTVLKRTITGITSTMTTYTASQQIVDFGSTQATVYYKWFQLSAVVGRGFEARGSV